jgi:hypothetical protein
MTFNYESMPRATGQVRAVNFNSGTEVQITVAERYRRLIVSSQGLCSTCPIFTPWSPISARAFGTSSPNQDIRFFDELAPRSVWSSAGNTTANQETRETAGRKRASERVKQPICQNEIRPSR